MWKRLGLIVVAGVVMIATVHVQAMYAKDTILIPLADVVAIAPTDFNHGRSYVVRFQVPALHLGHQLESAIIDFYIDAASAHRDVEVFPDTDSTRVIEFDNPTPLVELYALTGSMTSELKFSLLDRGSRRVRAVRAGESEHVRMDITGIVQSFIEHPSRNNGIVIGSMGGMREGDFRLLSGRLPDNAVVRIRLYSHARQ